MAMTLSFAFQVCLHGFRGKESATPMMTFATMSLDEAAGLADNFASMAAPAGFCTLTCQIYKWEQLFKNILKGYSTDSTEYKEWIRIRGLTPGPTRSIEHLACAIIKIIIGQCGVK